MGLLVELMREPVGRIISDVDDRCVTYVDIALLPRAQGRGLATSRLCVRSEEPRRLSLPARVNVLARNVASLKLCERLGFVRLADAPPFVRLEWKGMTVSLTWTLDPFGRDNCTAAN